MFRYVSAGVEFLLELVLSMRLVDFKLLESVFMTLLLKCGLSSLWQAPYSYDPLAEGICSPLSSFVSLA